jgi:hypothetical protein
MGAARTKFPSVVMQPLRGTNNNCAGEALKTTRFLDWCGWEACITTTTATLDARSSSVDTPYSAAKLLLSFHKLLEGAVRNLLGNPAARILRGAMDSVRGTNATRLWANSPIKQFTD